jgi:hypothetical protein
MAAEAVAAMRSSSGASLSGASLSTLTESNPAWAHSSFDGRRVYIRCGDDHGMPRVAQDAVVAESGVTWDIHHFNTSHSPFLSQPAQLADTIVRLAKTWTA